MITNLHTLLIIFQAASNNREYFTLKFDLLDETPIEIVAATKGVSLR